jgi:hypothetical protein
MFIYLSLMYVVSLALGYVLTFTNATLSIGKALSNAGTPTGYQDAITPPWFSTFAIAVYVASLIGIIYGWWEFGLLSGLGVTVGFFVVVIINKVILLPKNDSDHFRNIIVRSMIKRHADYLKSGDTVRATVMSELLEKMGMPVNEFVERLQKSSDT